MKKLISLIMTVVMVCSVFMAFDVTASAVSKSVKLKSVTNTAKAITVKWSKTSGATKYIVQKKTSGQKTYKNIKTTGKSTYSYSDKSVKAGTTYSYKVVAVQGTNQYVSKAKSVTRLLAPTGLTVKSGNELGVVLNWKKTKGAKKYDIYRKTTGKYKKIDTASSNKYYDFDAKSGFVNYYKVVAANGSSKSVYSKAVKITYLDPVYVTGIATKDGIKLEWMKSKGAQGYKIYKTTGLKSYTLLKTVSSKYTSYVDKDVTDGTTYKYYIVAYKGSAVSAKSTATSVKYAPILTIDIKVGESNTKFKDYLETNRELLGDDAVFFDYLTFTYESVNPEIATVDKDGTVTGVSVGSTQIAVFVSLSVPGVGSENEESGYFLVNVTE